MVFLLCLLSSILLFIIPSEPSLSLLVILVTEGQVIRNIPRSVKLRASVFEEHNPDLHEGISIGVKIHTVF